MKTPVRSEEPAAYALGASIQTEDAIIARALEILRGRMTVKGDALTAPEAVKNYLRLRLAQYPYEVFGVLFLDNRHRVIKYEELFRGTIDGASVHPREVVRACIAHNAAAVIFAHNHPSGISEQSQADVRITKRLTEALKLIEVRVLDHIIIGDVDSMSFAERGIL